MMRKVRPSHLAIAALLTAITSAAGFRSVRPQPTRRDGNETACRIEATEFDGWQAQQMTNRWLTLTLVPKLGGRLMQASFAGHPFLFVNPKYREQYFPPSEDTRNWVNYGGDKVWPMPEGSQDDQHWPGPISDPLDDGDYAFHIISQGSKCSVGLAGPPDARTGLQYSREIGIGSDSSEISFHATMKNASAHAIRWSIQSVTQYDTADRTNPATYNHEFWAFTPASQHSSYLDGYHVRSGLAEDPSYSIKDQMFSLHWLDLQSEVWIDSPAGWLAVVDGLSRFGMVERFHFDPAAEYPGKATVIFYKNGPAVGVDANGKAEIRTGSDDAPFYMEAEVNSPMVGLAPGASYTFDTEWFPTRIGSEFKTATDAGVIGEPLKASATGESVKLSATIGVFFPGKLAARFYDSRGAELSAVSLRDVDPAEIVDLNQEMKAPAAAERISLRLVSDAGVDRGSMGDAKIERNAGALRRW
jgi:hypothetical protein